jgi:ProP effector
MTAPETPSRPTDPATPQRPRNAQQRPPAGANTPGGARGARSPRVHPLLEQLARLYPQLFGEVFRPLKRGIFEDIVAAHPEQFPRDALKEAIGQHTRSTRYLTSIASGLARHDLQGNPVEAMAPEHVYHALVEVFRRRQSRAGEDLRPKWRDRVVQAFEASGLTRTEYVDLVRSRDEAANAVLEEAMAEVAMRAAKDEALLRAFEASGQTLEAFADMYGMDSRTASRSLDRARKSQSPAMPET